MAAVSFRDPELEEVLMLQGVVPPASQVALGNLERFTGRPIQELSADYWRSRKTSDRQAQDHVAASTDEATVIDYYRDTQQYLYELTYVEGSIKRQGWLQVLERACRRFGLQHVLDLGGGIGSVSLYLAQRGIRCDYTDVRGKTFAYAAWRFALHRLNVAMFDATQAWPTGPYDAIIAWDVLEHLKEMEEKLGWIAQRLRPGGLLIHWSTFTECEGVHLPENMAYGDVRQYDALLQRKGFRYRGQLKPNQLSRLLRQWGWRTATLGIRLNPRLKFSGCFLIHERVAA